MTMATTDEIDDDVRRLNKLLWRASKSASESRKYRKNCEEFYYSDVDNTLNQFNEKQNKEIANTYNIPVSTKFTYSVVEQLLSFLTATKPFPKLLSTEASQEEWVATYQKAYHCVFYESKGYDQLCKVLRDSLNTGLGYFHVRRAYFSDESTTNVVIEHRPWKHILVDPECRKEDFSDAEFIVDVDIMRRKKAEEMYDITIEDDNSTTAASTYMINDLNDLANDYMPFDTDGKDVRDKHKYILVKNFYEIKEINVYVCSNEYEEIYGFVTTKKPKPIIMPNPQLALLGQQIQQLTQQIQQTQQQVQQSQSMQKQVMDTADTVNEQNFQQSGQQVQQLDQASQQGNAQLQQMIQELEQMQVVFGQLPKTIPGFSAEKETPGENGKMKKEIITATKVLTKKKRRVLNTLVVGNQKVNTEYISCDKIPIVPVPFSFYNNPNKVYGMVHYILDIVKAMNKYLSEIMYDISVNGHRKGFIWKGTILEPDKLESKWAQPNALIELQANPALPDGGKPFFLEPSNTNQSIQYMLNYYKEISEYITGIYGVMTGNPSDSPNTFGATQSLQNFGSQRIKLYSRSLETSLENLAYVVVSYLQAYTPRDKVMKYFDEDGNGQEITIMENSEDMNFKVRVEIVNSLPTTRQMMAQTLGYIAQTAGNPQLTSLLTEEMLKVADVPEAKEIAKKMDIMQQMQQQLQQMEQSLQDAQGQVKVLQNNMAEAEISHNIKLATEKAKGNVALAEQSAISQVQPEQQQEEQIMPSFMQNMGGNGNG